MTLPSQHISNRYNITIGSDVYMNFNCCILDCNKWVHDELGPPAWPLASRDHPAAACSCRHATNQQPKR